MSKYEHGFPYKPGAEACDPSQIRGTASVNTHLDDSFLPIAALLECHENVRHCVDVKHMPSALKKTKTSKESRSHDASARECVPAESD